MFFLCVDDEHELQRRTAHRTTTTSSSPLNVGIVASAGVLSSPRPEDEDKEDHIHLKKFCRIFFFWSTRGRALAKKLKCCILLELLNSCHHEGNNLSCRAAGRGRSCSTRKSWSCRSATNRTSEKSADEVLLYLLHNEQVGRSPWSRTSRRGVAHRV
ncbi:unnamed protein product [Amoebophrya sp. A120]|nr:unnamed protein product [Amoebophrya sp. A120]|eukprot:GSA120T00014760001.1